MKKIYLYLLCIFAVSVSFAQNASWKGGATSPSWALATNWTTSITPNSTGTTTFNNAASNGSILDATYSTKQLLFTTSVATYTGVYGNGQARASVVVPAGGGTGSTTAGDGVTINGLVYAAVNGAPVNPGEWNYNGATAAIDATALALAINNDTRTGTLGKVSALSIGATVTVIAEKDGTAYNAVTLTNYVFCTGPATLSGGATSTNSLTLDPQSVNTTYTSSLNAGIIVNPSVPAKVVINCKVIIGSTGSNAVNNIFLNNSTGHILEFGANSILDLSPLNGGDVLFHSAATGNAGTFNFKGSVIGNKALLFTGGSIVNNFLPGATVGSGVTLRFYNSGGTVNVNMNDNELLYSGLIWASNDGTLNVNATNSLATNLTVSGGKTLTLNVNKSLSGMKSISLGVPGDIIAMTMATNKTISFDAQTNTWGSGKLQITGFVPGTIRFGTDNTGLSTSQLAQITLIGGSDAGRPVTLDANGYLVINTTTWDGFTWSNSAPTSGAEAIIAGPYSTTTNGAITANKLTVSASPLGSLTINSGTNVTVTNQVINNAGANGIVVENNANLIQTNSVANTGNVVVNRNSSPLLRLDYTLWSSPVTGAQTLADFSPLTSQSPSRFYSFDTTFNTGGVNGAYSVINTPTSTTFTAGKGYLIRMPNTADAVTPTAYSGVFTGIPNNGNVPVTLVYGAATGLRYNLVGNPYPSTIKMQKFVFDNTANIESTLYFWRKTNGAGTAYCTWTAGALVTDPGTFVTNGNAQSVDPLDVIQTGQGFFVEAKSGATTVTFNNGQRIANNAGQFFKTKQVVDAGRVWLNATNAAGDFSQMAVTYSDQATVGVDRYDGKFINDSKFALTSDINGEEYTIQGRPAFDATDIVALNFKAENAGTFTIAKDHADGLFAAGQDVYLVDASNGTETNLQTDAYTFAATAGASNARFSLKYQKTLGVNANTLNDNSVKVYRNNGIISVSSGNNTISNIKVYDIQGRVIAEQKNVNATTATITNLRASHQVVLVKVTGADNTVVTKKVVN